MARPLVVKLERRGRLLVARNAAKVAPLRASTVERTRRDLLAARRGRRHFDPPPAGVAVIDPSEAS